MSKISRSIRHLLEAEKMTGSQLALDLNVSEQMVSHMKNDRRKMPIDIAEAALKKFCNGHHASLFRWMCAACFFRR